MYLPGVSSSEDLARTAKIAYVPAPTEALWLSESSGKVFSCLDVEAMSAYGRVEDLTCAYVCNMTKKASPIIERMSSEIRRKNEDIPNPNRTFGAVSGLISLARRLHAQH